MDDNRGLWRGKSCADHEWIIGDLLQVNYANGKRVCSIMPRNPVAENYVVIPEILDECTGLRDKNGKLIFEGDIVLAYYNSEEKTATGTIRYGKFMDTDSLDDYGYLGWYIEVQGHCISILQPEADGICIEVIGNIHDNPELLKNSKATRIYVIDTETTGLDRDEDEILQLSIVDESGCTVYNSLFRPERHTSWEEAEKINHITPGMVANAPTFKEMLPMINEIFSFCGTVIGYNTGFDLAFLQKAGVEFREDIKVIDVQAMFTPIAGEWDWQQNKYKWQSLVKCAEYCGYEWRGSAHDSLADALATLYCYNSLVEKNGMIVRKV